MRKGWLCLFLMLCGLWTMPVRAQAEKPFHELWRINLNNPIPGLSGGVGITSQVISWDTDSYRFAVVQSDGISIWDAENQQQIQFIKTPSNYSRGIYIEWHPLEDWLLYSKTDSNYETLVWDIVTGEIIRTYQASGQVIWSPNGNYLSGDLLDIDGTLEIWDQQEHIITTTPSLLSHGNLAWSPDGRYIADVATWEVEYLLIWDAETGELTDFIQGYQQVAWDSESIYLATNAMNGVVIRSAPDWQTILYMPDAGDVLSWQPQGNLLAINGSNLLLFDTTTGEQVQALIGHNAGGIISAAWSSDGRYLASAGVDQSVIVWGQQ